MEKYWPSQKLRIDNWLKDLSSESALVIWKVIKAIKREQELSGGGGFKIPHEKITEEGVSDKDKQTVLRALDFKEIIGVSKVVSWAANKSAAIAIPISEKPEIAFDTDTDIRIEWQPFRYVYSTLEKRVGKNTASLNGAKEEWYWTQRELIGEVYGTADKESSVVKFVPKAYEDSKTCGFRRKEDLNLLVKSGVIKITKSQKIHIKHREDFELIEAKVDWVKLSKEAEFFHDSTEAPSPRLKIEQQKDHIKQRLTDRYNEYPQEIQDRSERILGTFEERLGATPDQVAKSNNNIERNFEFMTALRELEKEVFLKILDVNFNFNALPTHAQKSSTSWYPAEHCKVKLKLIELAKRDYKQVMPTTSEPSKKLEKRKLHFDGRNLTVSGQKLTLLRYALVKITYKTATNYINSKILRDNIIKFARERKKFKTPKVVLKSLIFETNVETRKFEPSFQIKGVRGKGYKLELLF